MATAGVTNSYATAAEAEDYFDARLHTDAWTAANDDDKERSLIQATRILDTYFEWYEEPDKAAAPQAVKDATYEMALVLLSGDVQVKDDLDGLSSVSLGGLEVTSLGISKRMIPKHVVVIITDLGTVKGTSGSIDLVRS